ncbi:MAG: insulinase family protein, partial [Candidatus Rokuibacteriota bacterium]
MIVSTPMRRLSLVLLGLLLAGCAPSAPAPVPAPRAAVAPNPAPAREVLPNGVVLITQEHRAADVVAVQVWMQIGGRDEQGDELGLTHYLEHMLFKGTP